jgi:hypothetical protein
VGGLSPDLATALRDRLALRRGIETGTLHGGGARLMAGIFEQAVSIELSVELHAAATEALRDVANVRLVQGDSRTVLATLRDPSIPTLYFLDGHWSGGNTSGHGAECPVLEELAALTGGHPEDCVVIDDARLFAAAPPAPHDPQDWPTLMEVFDAVRRAHPGHHVTLLHDQVLAVPASARDLLDDWSRAPGGDDRPLRRGRRIWALPSLRAS